MENEKGRTRSHCMENSLWKAEYRMNERMDELKKKTTEFSDVCSKTHDVPLQNSIHIN